MQNIRIAYQLYSAREEAAKDLSGVLKTLRDQGYEGVEFAGFYGRSAEEVKALLKKKALGEQDRREIENLLDFKKRLRSHRSQLQKC